MSSTIKRDEKVEKEKGGGDNRIGLLFSLLPLSSSNHCWEKVFYFLNFFIAGILEFGKEKRSTALLPVLLTYDYYDSFNEYGKDNNTPS